MSTVKDRMRQVIEEQPEDASFDEILRELAFARMVERGSGDAEAGRTISHEDMEKRLASWRR